MGDETYADLSWLVINMDDDGHDNATRIQYMKIKSGFSLLSH